jgi:hypothetical protein
MKFYSVGKTMKNRRKPNSILNQVAQEIYAAFHVLAKTHMDIRPAQDLTKHLLRNCPVKDAILSTVTLTVMIYRQKAH